MYTVYHQIDKMQYYIIIWTSVALGFSSASVSYPDVTSTCVTSDGQSCNQILENSYANLGCKFSHTNSTLRGYSLTISLTEPRPVYGLSIVQCRDAENVKKFRLQLDDGSTQELMLSMSDSNEPWAEIFYIHPVFSKNVTLEIVEMREKNESYIGLNQISVYDTSTKVTLSALYGSSCAGTYPGCSGAIDSTIAGVFIGFNITDDNRWKLEGPAIGTQFNITFLKSYLIDQAQFYQLYDLKNDNGSFCKIKDIRLEFSDGTTQQVTLHEECTKYGVRKYLNPVTTNYVHMTIISTYNEDDTIPAGFEEIKFLTLGPYEDAEVIFPTLEPTCTSTRVLSGFLGLMWIVSTIHFAI